MVCSQRSGRCRKASGDIKMASPAQASGTAKPAIRPMSWKCGSQDTMRAPVGIRKSRVIMRRLWARLAWVSTTPFGSAVEPEVYWISTGADGSAGGASKEGGAEGESESSHEQARSGE